MEIGDLDYRGNPVAICTVGSFEYETDWYKGQASVTLLFFGMKAYDKEGGTYSHAC